MRSSMQRPATTWTTEPGAGAGVGKEFVGHMKPVDTIMQVVTIVNPECSSKRRWTQSIPTIGARRLLTQTSFAAF